MPTYRIHDLNGRVWQFGVGRALKIAAGSLKGFDGAEFSLNTLQGVGQRGVTVVGSDFKPGMIAMSVVVQPYQVGVRGGSAVEMVRQWRDGLGEGEVERNGNQLRLYVADSDRWQAIRLVTKGQINWERVAASQMCKDDLVFQSDESDWRAEPLSETFTPAEFSTATVSSDGTVDSWPHFVLTGPITNPTLGLDGEAVRLPTLAAGHRYVIETDPNWYSVTEREDVTPWTGSKSATTLPPSTWTDLLSFTASGGGDRKFAVQHSWGNNLLHLAPETRGVRILVDGVEKARQQQTYTIGSWSATLERTINVADGDVVKIQGYAAGSVYSQPRTVAIGSASASATLSTEGADRTFDLYTLADGSDDRWRKQVPARASDVPVTITGTGTTSATKLEVIVPQIFRSAL